MLVLVLAAAAGASVTVAWLIDRRRGSQRNNQGKCAACGISWAETTAGDPYLIHGRLVCEGCAGNARRRLPWHFGIIAGATAIATGATLAGNGIVAMLLVPVGATIVMTLGTIKLMKLANRKAQRRIALGEFPGFETLRIETNIEPE